MKNYPNTLKRNLLNTISQMQKELPQYTSDPQRNFTRNRKLPFEKLCRTILSMSGQNLHVELQRQFHYEPTAATASAFVQQRRKLLPSVFEEILRRFALQNRPKRQWNGYTLLAVDGSHVQIPSDIHDEATYFNSTKDGRGYNLLHLNALYDLESQLYLDAVIQNGREENESQALVKMVDRSALAGPVILIADRGYEAYNNMAHIEQKGWNYLIRVKEKQGILSGLQLPDTPEFEAVFSYCLSKRLTNRIRQEPQKYRWLPKKVHFDYIIEASDTLYPISFRVVRFMVKEGLYETVITNLPANRFPPSLLRMLYHKRWGIETSFRDLKYTLALTHFHAKKRSFIMQEIFAKMTLYNFASLLRLHAGFMQPKGKYSYRVNAAFAAHIAREFLLGFVSAAKVESLIASFLLPVRPGQQKPRNMRVKRPVSFQYRAI